MCRKTAIILFVISLIVCLSFVIKTAALPANAEEPKRIAVLQIKTGTGISHWWEGSFDPGQAMTDIMINKLLKLDRYQVFNRAELDKIMQEHNLGISGEITPDTACEIGKLVGVQYIVTGTVTEFSQVSSSGGGGFGAFGVAVGGGNKKVRVSCEIHLTDVNTGMYSAGISGKEEANAGSVAFGGYYGGVGVGYSNEEFASSALGKAMYKVCDQMVEQMATVKFKEYQGRKKVEGYVLQVDGSDIYISVGKKDNIVVRDKFLVSRPKTIKDPRTGEEKAINKPVGEIQVISVDETSSTCKAGPSCETIQANDKVIMK